MSTQDKLDQYLKDPMSMSEEDIDAYMSDGGDDSNEASNKQSELKEGETAQDTTPGVEEGKKDEANAAEGKSADPDADKAKAEADKEDPEKSFIQSKNGKHAIPYSVLQGERERAIRAEQAARELAEKLALMEKSKESGETVKTADVGDIVDPELLDTLREESPGIADVLDRLIGKINTLESEHAKTSSFVQEGTKEAAVQRQLTVEEAIAEVPKLSHVRTNDPEKYNEIAEFDQMLRAQSKWHSRPMKERFEAAVRMYESANGPIELPGSSGGQPDDEATEQKVAAAVAKAQKQGNGPNTLSDIPGGAPAASNDHDALGEMTSTALTERFMGMTQEQIEAELARLS
ncbi:MAG: hypothetical protein CML16_03065 [Pusillimonas sp.]|nr:hypothetical protein [Pusillimonas sp.]MBC43568.1 hypothetical protein [Pusillimonas sp.]|tara:strand:+ start:9562 stop:10602 length:1041 start_codon:yes stop_codon:yes gene_type:complete